jgi:hypothetical protein
MNPGSIVTCRNRDWVLLPNEDPNILLLRPLTGATDEVVAVHKGPADLIGYSLPEERVRSAKFPPPTPNDVSSAAGAHLLWQAARLTLREGATPLRSLGHAFTHIGRDIDGKTWVEPCFGQSALPVVEGLAQFYAVAVAEKLTTRAPGALPAFKKLLQFQSPAYKAHEDWLKDSPAQRGEPVRFAMLRARLRGKVSYDDWLKMLCETKQTPTPERRYRWQTVRSMKTAVFSPVRSTPSGSSLGEGLRGDSATPLDPSHQYLRHETKKTGSFRSQCRHAPLRLPQATDS